MPELGLVVYLIAISYGMGALWYTLLGRSHASWTRMTAFSRWVLSSGGPAGAQHPRLAGLGTGS